MFMFQNGLLATFIPEVFMVIAFVLCLFAPGFQSHNASCEQAPIMAQVSFYELKQTSIYQQSTYNFDTYSEFIPEKVKISPHFIQKKKLIPFKSHFSTSDGLSFVDFSRPPPCFLS